jgi:hypothetical protein
MDINDNIPSFQDNESADEEIGSDELLSDDNLRLPESANVLVRLHAVRAWLARRHEEVNIEVGEAALDLQQAMQEDLQEMRPRRRARQGQEERLQHAQQGLTAAQQRLNAYEEAQSILEDCVAHTSGERVLVEYYLTLEELMLYRRTHSNDSEGRSPWIDALGDVLRRIERVGSPNEE